MAWNEPSGNGKDQKDPWTGQQKPQEGGPPDLDEAMRQLKKKISDLMGGAFKGEGNRRPSGSGPERADSFGKAGLGLLAIIALVIWFFSGIFIVDPAEQAVILRFGRYVETVGPGPHWIPRFIESAYVVNTQKISTYSYDSQMLTQDENIVSVALAVQYRIDNTKDYLFNAVNPRESLQQATASALRQVIGRTSLDAVLTSGRDKVRQEVQTILAQTLRRYNTGLLITDVAMQPAKAPDEVKEAFDDAIKAQEDEQRFQNQAQAYAMQVEPIAKGQAQRLLADATAYKQQVVLRAQGDVSGFLAVLPQYQRSTAVTRDRMYIDTLESVLSKSTKILVDVNGGNNMFYLPLDKLLEKLKKEAEPVSVSNSAQTAPPMAQTTAAAEQSTETSVYPSSGGYQ